MGWTLSRRWLLGVVVVLAFAVGAAALAPGGAATSGENSTAPQTNTSAAFQTANEPPSADFTYSPDPGVAGQPIEFDASSSTDDGEIVEYNWDWDGDETFEQTTAEPTANHTFFSNGTKSVGLRVTDDDGASSFTEYRNVEVVEPNVVARCSVEPTTVTVGQNVTIDATASENASLIDYNFGDGNQLFETTDFQVTHSYAEPGNYTTSITVYSGTGQTDTADCPTVTVQPANERPTGDFTYSPDPGIAGQSMTFDASGSADPDGTVEQYEWDWDGDETYEDTTTEPTIDHTYFSSGFKNVGLRVTDDDGATNFPEYRDVEVVEPNVVARCSVEPQTVTAGQPVLIDATASENASLIDYDFQGDGEYDRFEQRNFTWEHVYEEPGEYVPIVRVYGGVEQRDVEECGTVTVQPRNEPPEASFTYDPDPGIAGQPMTFDASGATDTDGTIEQYEWDWDGDETFEETTTEPTIDHTYFSSGFKNVGLRVTDNDNATDVTYRDVKVVEPRLRVECTVEPSTVEPGEEVTIQVRESDNASYLDYDLDGDGEYERFERTEFTVTTSYNETGTYTPLVRVYSTGESRAVFECEQVTVEQPPDEGGIPDWWPIPAAGIGLLGLGGLGYYILGGGGGGGGGKPKPKPKPKPHGTTETTRYETGVFELPTSSGTLSIPVGFEPDLILFSAGNGARTDTATDRTAGWSRGIAHVTADGPTNQCLTVADDAHSTDQATCAADDDLAIQIVRHEADGPPGRVTAKVTATTGDSFEVETAVPGDDPLAGGIRVLYQAFRTGSDVDVEAGTLMTPTEPGTQTVDLGIEADYVSLSVSAAVADADQLWTTDRGVGLSTGHAVAEPESSIDQAVAGTSAWPGTGHPTAGVADDAAALHLLYQDGDRLAGRTSARATALGQTLRLQYDRVYNGPHKLGSIARHPISYLAMAGGQAMRPAVGTFSLPRPGEQRTVDCGFQPGLIEFQIAPAPLGEEVAAGATPHPFGWSQGTAIVDDERLRQYVLNHAVVPDQPDAAASGAATDTGGSGTRASTDGGQASESPSVDVGEMAGTIPEMDLQPRGKETGAVASPDTETGTAPAAAEHDDDGRAGLWLATGPDGTIVGRDELRVTGITETDFRTAVESVDTNRRGTTGPRPTVVYRAWPAVDVTGAPESQRTERTPEGTTEGPPETNQNVDTTDLNVDDSETGARR